MEFEIYKNQKNKYIQPGTVLVRWYNSNSQIINVTSDIYLYEWSDNSMHEMFDCIINHMKGDYYVSDLFNGDRVMVIKKDNKRVIEENDEIVIISKEI